jgi:hypothetical protein
MHLLMQPAFPTKLAMVAILASMIAELRAEITATVRAEFSAGLPTNELPSCMQFVAARTELLLPRGAGGAQDASRWPARADSRANRKL